MSEKSVILLENISSSQADTVSVFQVVASSFFLKFLKKSYWREAKRVRWEVRRDQLNMCVRQSRVRKRMWRTRTSKSLLAWMKFESLRTSLRVPRPQTFCDGRGWGCPRQKCRGSRWHLSPSPIWVFISSTFTVNFSTRNSLLASHWILLGYLCCACWNMEMTSWGSCVLVYISSGEPLVRLDEPRFPQTDVFFSEFEVDAPILEEKIEKKKKTTKRAVKCLFMPHLENWLISILPCWFSTRSVVSFSSFRSLCRNCSGDFRKRSSLDWRGDWWAFEVASHSCYREPGTVGRGPSMTILRFSTVRDWAASCWSGHLVLVVFLFKWGI